MWFQAASFMKKACPFLKTQHVTSAWIFFAASPRPCISPASCSFVFHGFYIISILGGESWRRNLSLASF